MVDIIDAGGHPALEMYTSGQGENILYLWTLDRQFLQNLQKQTTGTVFTNLSSSLTNPGGEEELLLPLRQLILKHIFSTYPPKG